MARNETIKLIEGQWVQLTNADVTKLRVQVWSQLPIKIMATVGAVAPTSDSGAIELTPGPIMPATYTLEEIWPGVVGAKRVYAFAPYDDATVSVSHA